MLGKSVSKRQMGFTLIELMIVIAIVAIALAIAAPSFQNIVESNRLRTEANKLVSALGTAKSEAVKRNTPVLICPTLNGTGCGGNLDAGWMMYIGNDPDSPDLILRVSEGVSSGFNLRSEAGAVVTASVRYNPDGSVGNGVTVLVCPSDNDISKALGVTVDTVGLPRVRKDDDDLDWKCSP